MSEPALTLPSQTDQDVSISGKTVSLVVPFFNEADALPLFFDAIGPVAQQVKDVLRPGAQLEVVFVDDGSTDGSVDYIKSVANSPFSICIVKLSRNFKKDSALAAGLRHASGDAVIPMDVDLQDPPDLIPKMLEAWQSGAKMVNAKRVSRTGDSVGKRTLSNAFYWAINRISDYPIEPNVGDFRLLDREVVERLNELTERVRFMKGLFAWVGFDPVTIEYERPTRSAGDTNWNFWKLWNFALDGITGSTTLPIRAWTYLGTMTAIFAVFYAVFIIAKTVFWGVDAPGYASLMVVVLLLGACNLIALGLIGEYIGRINVETKQRPSYVIDTIIELPKGEATEDHENDMPVRQGDTEQ
ncbi:glycosyltransferase family 2 protein [Ruegeria sp. HKCCA5426]|uniref:glycosyltransferase family 2 protein n=1 Tax=Ruegeria sp. HKCCA5426 TaxID=2682985 RepID=UPI001489435F|nr:glycosyltransferase family 2 protein [Ruegeria sp. HKCCA5426]